LSLHDEKDDFENACVGKDESMEGEVVTNLTFLKDITLDDFPFKNLEESDPICPLEDDIEDYFHIEKEKWEIIGPRFDCAPIYNTDKEDEIGLPLLSGIIYDDISIDTFGKENYYFPSHEEGHLEVINSPFKRDPICDMKEIDKAPTYPPYDSIFKSPEPLHYYFGEEKPIEYNTLPSPLSPSLFESGSRTCSHMISSDLDPSPLSKYSIEEEPLIEYSLSPWAPPKDHDKSIISPFPVSSSWATYLCFSISSVSLSY